MENALTEPQGERCIDMDTTLTDRTATCPVRLTWMPTTVRMLPGRPTGVHRLPRGRGGTCHEAARRIHAGHGFWWPIRPGAP